MDTPWAAVDLHALQVELPDNLYWKMAVPTKDQAITFTSAHCKPSTNSLMMRKMRQVGLCS